MSEMGRRELENRYYKDGGEGDRYISGLALPRGDDGLIRDIRFVKCDFHPICGSLKNVFVGCEFIECEGQEYLVRRESNEVSQL